MLLKEVIILKIQIGYVNDSRRTLNAKRHVNNSYLDY